MGINAQRRSADWILARMIVFLLALAACTGAFAQKKEAPRLQLAINEGGAANADATDTVYRFEEFGQILSKAIGVPIAIVPLRDRKVVREQLKRHAYAFLFQRPNDVPAEAIRDWGYQPVVNAKEASRALFIVKADSPLKSITDVKGKSIVTPDQYSNMWRVANAMLRDAKIDMAQEKVRAMRDQAAIGWSMEGGFFDVAVVNSVSGVGRTWEMKGGRVIARSVELPNMPLIASPDITAAQILKIRAALVNIEATDAGQAMLKKIGLTGFREANTQEFLDFIKWLGDLPAGAQ
jgi:ABC-type phosphate/phosphonate transport system substrate-binding protein